MNECYGSSMNPVSYGKQVSHNHLSNLQSVDQDAATGAQKQHTRSHACSSARNAVQSVCVCQLAPMATSKPALATITGRPRGVDLNALEYFHQFLAAN